MHGTIYSIKYNEEQFYTPVNETEIEHPSDWDYVAERDFTVDEIVSTFKEASTEEALINFSVDNAKLFCMETIQELKVLDEAYAGYTRLFTRIREKLDGYDGVYFLYEGQLYSYGQLMTEIADGYISDGFYEVKQAFDFHC
jgi:hypothetical protein